MFVAALFIISQKLESTQRSSNWWMDKQTVVYPCNGIQFSNKKKQTADTCNTMDVTYCTIPFTKQSRSKNEGQKSDQDCQGLEARVKGEEIDCKGIGGA